MKMFISAMLAFTIGFANNVTLAQSSSSDTLTNKSVIALKKAGMDKKIIILKIKNSQSMFDLSTNGLVELKKEGIDDDIIESMLTSKQVAIVKTPLPAKEDKTVSGDSANLAITYNDRTCFPSAISAQVYDANDRNILGGRINKAMYVDFVCEFPINTSTTMKLIMRRLQFSGKSLEAEKLILTKVSGYNSSDVFVKENVDDDWHNYFYVTYTKNGGMEGVPIFPNKVGFRRSYVEIKSINRTERTFSGIINIDAETNDGTPLKIKGTFNNISYDGGLLADPLNQR